MLLKRLKKSTNWIGLKMTKISKMILYSNKCGNKWEAINSTNKLRLIERNKVSKGKKLRLRFLTSSKSNINNKNKSYKPENNDQEKTVLQYE